MEEEDRLKEGRDSEKQEVHVEVTGITQTRNDNEVEEREGFEK